jgi:hypothetical protein
VGGVTDFRLLIAEARNAVPALTEEIAARVTAEVDELAGGGPEVAGSLRASTTANLDLVFAGLAADQRLPAELPPEAREFARLMARLGVRLEVLLRMYRIGHAVTWERWLALAEARIADPAKRTAAITEASRYMFDWVDSAAARIAELYATERDAVRRGRERRALGVVRDVLAGRGPSPADAYAALDYDLDGWHVALVVSGPSPELAVAEAARALGASQRLVVPLSAEVAWAWVGRRQPFEPALPPATSDAAIAAGGAAEGLDGFRRSHAQAREAHRVGELGRLATATYEDSALLALAVRDGDAARMFCEEELRGIDGDDARSRALRDTLLAWFTAGHNGASAAAALGAHENTVANRLRTVEERTGRPLTSRRAELEVALRLRALL